ncbi:MAG: hypothetical protein ACQCXQ_14855 [Verrucomicrobiales bacterium]|nr:hypothetical protein [Verrucomicrobiota bacterium JB025]
MFSAKQLSPEQVDALKQQAAAGATLSDLQRQIKDEFGISATYMDTRFAVLDLGIELAGESDNDPTQSGEDEVIQPEVVATGQTTVTLDQITLPGALVSGRVTFSDGETAIWMLDQSGRPGLDPDTPGYRPTENDIIEFQTQLRGLLDNKDF